MTAPAPKYTDLESSFAEQEPAATDFDGLLKVTGVSSFKDLNVEVMYSSNTQSTLEYLAKWKKSYLDFNYRASAEEVDPDILIDDLTAELVEQFGAVLLPGEGNVETQLTVLLDIEVKVGAMSGAITTVDIGEYYIEDSSGRLLFSTHDRGVGSIPYPADTIGFGDAKNMALAHICKRFAGLEWDEAAEMAAAENKAAQTKGEAVRDISNSVAEVAQAAANYEEVKQGQGAAASQGAAEAPVLSSSGHYGREYYQNQYDKQKQMALSMLKSFYHRTIYEDQLYGETGGKLGSRPNSTLDVSLLQAYRSSQSRMRAIRNAAKRDGYDIAPSGVETYNP